VKVSASYEFLHPELEVAREYLPCVKTEEMSIRIRFAWLVVIAPPVVPLVWWRYQKLATSAVRELDMNLRWEPSRNHGSLGSACAISLSLKVS